MRAKWFGMCLALVLLSVCAAPGLASDDGAPAGPITATRNDVDLAFWSLVVFTLFFLVLSKYAWGPLNEALDRREQRILSQMADAEQARTKAEKMLAEHASRLERAQDEIQDLLAQGRKDAEQARVEIVATAQKEADAARQRAVQDIERARDQALNELFANVANTVVGATEHVLGRSLNDSDQERLVQEALSAFPSRKA